MPEKREKRLSLIHIFMFWTVTQSLLTGLATTFEIFILTLIFALPLGLVLAFGLLSKFKPLQRLVQILVWIIRGTCLLYTSFSG